MIGLILIIILALVGPLINMIFEQNVDYRNLPQKFRIRQSSFYHLMVQVLMVKMLMQKWELKKLLVWNRSTW